MWRKAVFLFVLWQSFLPTLASETNVIISEIMYDLEGSDSGREWVEFYNLGADDLLVTSTWRFFDGNNHKIDFYQGSSTIASGEFFVLADKPEDFLLDYPNFSGNLFDTAMNLSNTSSSLALSFDNGQAYSLEDFYDSTFGGSNGYSLEKKDFLANNQDNWQTSQLLGGTPGQPNSTSSVENLEEDEREENSEAEEILEIADRSGLVINELLPNPVGSDDLEWIELYNQGAEGLTLDGLKIGDNSARKFTLNSESALNLWLEPGEYFLLEKGISGISLNNSSGDKVILFNSNDNIIDEVEYSDSALEGKAYARDGQNFVWTKVPTPGSQNIISINQAPVAQISVTTDDFVVGSKIDFSGEHSYDIEGGDLDYAWDFGDGEKSTRASIKHVFKNLGTYNVSLIVTDEEGLEDTTYFLIEIFQKLEDNSVGKINSGSKAAMTETEKEYKEITWTEDDLIISEFLPNPEGSDDKEWIEIYNSSDKPIDLWGWMLDDGEGGSKPFSIASSTIISAGGYFVFPRTETKLSLNNSGDSVRLLTPAGQLWQEVYYEKISEGQSYAFDILNLEWQANEPSPGQVNIFLQDKQEDLLYNVVDLVDLEKNDEVILQGVALQDSDSESKTLYLANYDFSQINFEEVAEIYSYYKDWPDIKKGQVLTIYGQLSKTGSLPRVKIKQASDILINDVRLEWENLEMMDLLDVSEDFLSGYIKTKGIVVKKSGKNIYLATELEEDYLLRLYNNLASENLKFNKGEEVVVSGILTESGGNFKLTPLSLDDIKVSQKVLGEKILNSDLLNTKLSSSTNIFEESDNKNKIKNNLIFISVGLLLIALVPIIKKRFLKNKHE